MNSDTFGAVFYDDVVSKDQDDFGAVFYQPQEKSAEKESLLKSTLRYAAQIPLGIAQVTIPGIVSNLAQAIGVGSALDEEELEQLRKIHAQQGKEFDEEAYRESLQQASEMFPTPSNIARMVEESTGLPLTPKTRGQEALQFAASAGKIIPKSGTPLAPHGTSFRGLNIDLPRPVLGAGVSAAREGLKEIVPEPISDVASFAVLKRLSQGAGSLSFRRETKPSGLPARQFEKIKSPREVSEAKIAKINKKLESDFKQISDKIIKESPVGETAKNLKENPVFKQESRELLDEAQKIADSISETLPSGRLKKELADTAARKVKGYALSEYDKNYMKFMKEASEDVIPKNIKAGEIVEQYRKNNAALSEYFEPGASKALNRAKRDALLDQNRSIAKVMEDSYPNSELVPVFKEGNARWTKIMDAETVDDFIGDIFSGKIDFRKMHEFFDKQGYDRIFKRALGEKGYAEFEQLMKDMLTSENAYKMLNVAKSRGYQDLFNTGLAYILHPKIAATKIGINILKDSYKGLINSLLDKPQIGLTFRKAVIDLRKGRFDKADKEFKKLKSEVEILPKEETIQPKKTEEALQAKVSPISKEIEPKRLESPKKQIEFKEPEKVSERKNIDEKESKIDLDDYDYKYNPKLGRMEFTKKQENISQTPKHDEKQPKKIKQKPENDRERLIKYLRKQTPSTYLEAEKLNEEIRTMMEQFSREEMKEIYKEASPHVTDKALNLMILKHKHKPISKRLKEVKNKPKQSLTQEAVQEVKRQDISKEGLKKQKQFILNKIDDAISNPKKYFGVEKIEFDVPGDGIFKIYNNKEALNLFKKNVEKKWPDKPLRMSHSKKHGLRIIQ